jgi:hypothetical protein
MSTQVALPEDDLRIKAFDSYKQTEDYANAKKWASFPEHVDGSLWAAFIAGYQALYKEITTARKEAKPGRTPESF